MHEALPRYSEKIASTSINLKLYSCNLPNYPIEIPVIAVEWMFESTIYAPQDRLKFETTGLDFKAILHLRTFLETGRR